MGFNFHINLPGPFSYSARMPSATRAARDTGRTVSSLAKATHADRRPCSHCAPQNYARTNAPANPPQYGPRPVRPAPDGGVVGWFGWILVMLTVMGFIALWLHDITWY